MREDDPFDLEQQVKPEPEPELPAIEDEPQVTHSAPLEGAELCVTVGGMKLSPVSYNSFETDRIALTVRVGPGESPEQAYDRARAVLAKLHQRAYQKGLDEYFEAIEDSSKQARARSRRG